MATSREQEAEKYLKKHRIPELINNLTSMLFFHRPDRPQEFLIEQLERLQASDNSCLFDESNLDSVFGILDPAGQGHITLAQYKEALSTLGIRHFDEFPEGADKDEISHDTFLREAKIGLAESSTTF